MLAYLNSADGGDVALEAHAKRKHALADANRKRVRSGIAAESSESQSLAEDMQMKELTSRLARTRVRRGRLVSYSKRAIELAEKDAREASDRLTRSLVLQQWEYLLLEGNPILKGECEGARIVRKINDALAHLDVNGFKRSSQQRLFHRAFMQASYSMLYGKDFSKHIVRLLAENRCSTFRTEVACTTPRRFGKTFSIAMWCASWLVVAADHDSSIYSTSARVSIMLLGLIVKMARILQQKFGGVIKELRKEDYVIYTTEENYENSVYAYPAKSETIRGTGTKRKMGTVVLEEAAYIPPAVVTSIVAPTLIRNNINLFAISTINEDDVVMKGFMTAKWPDGTPVMKCINFSLVCPACKRSGQVDTCKHMQGDLPHWASAEQHSKLQLLLKDSREVMQREINGLEVSETTKPAFEAYSLNRLADDSLSGIPAPMKHQTRLFCTVDPACGGATSALAVITCAYVDDNCIVVGGEEIGSCSATERKSAIELHITTLQKRPEFAGCTVVLCVESNLGAEAEHYYNHIRERKLKNVILMKDEKDKDGWGTTNETKKWGFLRMNQILNECRIKMYRGFVRAVRRRDEDTPEALKARIIEQLRDYMRIAPPLKNFWDKPKEYFSGKKNAADQRDDLAMAMQMSLLVYERYRKDFHLYEG